MKEHQNYMDLKQKVYICLNYIKIKSNTEIINTFLDITLI